MYSPGRNLFGLKPDRVLCSEKPRLVADSCVSTIVETIEAEYFSAGLQALSFVYALTPRVGDSAGHISRRQAGPLGLFRQDGIPDSSDPTGFSTGPDQIAFAPGSHRQSTLVCVALCSRTSPRSNRFGARECVERTDTTGGAKLSPQHLLRHHPFQQSHHRRKGKAAHRWPHNFTIYVEAHCSKADERGVKSRSRLST